MAEGRSGLVDFRKDGTIGLGDLLGLGSSPFTDRSDAGTRPALLVTVRSDKRVLGRPGVASLTGGLAAVRGAPTPGVLRRLNRFHVARTHAPTMRARCREVACEVVRVAEMVDVQPIGDGSDQPLVSHSVCQLPRKNPSVSAGITGSLVGDASRRQRRGRVEDQPTQQVLGPREPLASTIRHRWTSAVGSDTPGAATTVPGPSHSTVEVRCA